MISVERFYLRASADDALPSRGLLPDDDITERLDISPDVFAPRCMLDATPGCHDSSMRRGAS